MDGQTELTPRGRSQRSRRPPKQFEGALSWQEAIGLSRQEAAKEGQRGERQEGLDEADGDEEKRGEDGHGEEEDDEGDDVLMDDGSESQEMSLDGDGNTSDEFVPESDRVKRARVAEDDFGSDSGEEFGLSQGSDEEGLDGPEEDGSRLSPGSHQFEPSTLQRLDRAKRKTWVPPAGHGGLESPSDWRAAGQRNRQMQAEGEEPEMEDGIEVEGNELQSLADAFSGTGAEASVEQVERWQSALHDKEREPEEEDLDEAAFEQDVRGAIGFKRKALRNQGGQVRRAPRMQTLSAPVRALLTEANTAFVDADLPLTIAKLQEVIKLEPAVRSAWATLALCFTELGEHERALQSRIMEAHLTHHPIALWQDLASSSRERGYNEQAVYCLSKATTSSREKDRVDVIDIMWERSQLLEELNEPKRAAQSYLQMLHYRPQNQSIIRRLIPLLFQLNMLDRAIEILQRCEEWNMEAFPDPLLDPTMLDESVGPDVRYTYESSEVVTLADLLLRASRPQEALHTVRRGARWLDGRGGEAFWNDINADDREFDESREEADRTGEFGRRVDLAPTHYLEPEFRFQLAVARARMGDSVEAKRHFAIWQRDAHITDNIDHYSDLAEEFVRMGATEKGGEKARSAWYDEALEITSTVINERQRSGEYGDDPEAIIADYKRTAACYMGLNEPKLAVDWLKEVVRYNPDDFESMLRLAEAYEDMGERDTALETVTQVVRSKRERQTEQVQAGTVPPATDETLTQSLSFFAEIQQKSSLDGGDGMSKQAMREQRKELERIREMETSLAWKRLKTREEGVFVDRWWSADVDLAGDARRRGYGEGESRQAKEARFNSVSEWLSDAERLVSMFQNTTQLYPRNRMKKFKGVLRTKKKKQDMVDSQATAILARLGDDMFEEGQGRDTYEHSTFRGIKLDDWVTLIMQYAFVLTKVGEYDAAREVIERVIKSNVIWTDEARKSAVQLCLASCALYAQDHDTVIDQIKYFTFEYPFHNEPLRILLTLANSMGFPSAAALSQPHNLKTFLRRSRMHETLVQGALCKYTPATKRWVARDKLFKKMKSAKIRAHQASEEAEEDEDDLGDDDDDEEEGEREGEDRDRDRSPNKNTVATYGRAQDLWQDIKEDGSVDAVKAKPPTRYDPANDMFYAGLILTSSNGVPSMAYWTRVFARQQNDGLICLTVAVACFGRALNRQVDNRHQVVVQAFAFLHLYRKLRAEESNNRSEPSYNFARAFHLLSLYQLAVPHYQAVLQMRDREEGEKSEGKGTGNSDDGKRQAGFQAWPEAAYNLSLVYLNSGNPLMANEVMERYLRV